MINKDIFRLALMVKGISQNALATHLGMQTQILSNMVCGYTRISSATLIKISKHLEISTGLLTSNISLKDFLAKLSMELSNLK